MPGNMEGREEEGNRFHREDRHDRAQQVSERRARQALLRMYIQQVALPKGSKPHNTSTRCGYGDLLMP